MFGLGLVFIASAVLVSGISPILAGGLAGGGLSLLITWDREYRHHD